MLFKGVSIKGKAFEYFHAIQWKCGQNLHSSNCPNFWRNFNCSYEVSEFVSYPPMFVLFQLYSIRSLEAFPYRCLFSFRLTVFLLGIAWQVVYIIPGENTQRKWEIVCWFEGKTFFKAFGNDFYKYLKGMFTCRLEKGKNPEYVYPL